ncbi:MAG TPA: hypothetical protein VEI74_01825 [Candidatus Methylomirabilis sp.]|nr:hypothetical protein [Candidatus Methylomirabilis sp.]
MALPVYIVIVPRAPAFVIPAKAEIQALNGIARLARDSHKLLVGG